jgi:hypothetical protein
MHDLITSQKGYKYATDGRKGGTREKTAEQHNQK